MSIIFFKWGKSCNLNVIFRSHGGVLVTIWVQRKPDWIRITLDLIVLSNVKDVANKAILNKVFSIITLLNWVVLELVLIDDVSQQVIISEA